MSQPKVLIALSTIGGYEPDPLIPLKTAGFEILLNPHKRKLTAEEVKVLAKDCVGIVAGLEPLDHTVLDALPHLKVISRSGIGTDNIDMAHAAQKGIQICITAEAPIRSVVELTVGLLFDLFRNISKADRLIRAGKWNRLKGAEMSGKVAGVVGLGRIGRAVAETLKLLGMCIIASDPAADSTWCKQQGITIVSLPELLCQSDVVTLHVSKGTQNSAIIRAEELVLMRPHAFLINMSRGGVVDETALLKALTTGRLAGAALDVFEEEPYLGPLRDLDNVVLSPHMGTYTQEAREAMERGAVNNLIQALQQTHASQH